MKVDVRELVEPNSRSVMSPLLRMLAGLRGGQPMADLVNWPASRNESPAQRAMHRADRIAIRLHDMWKGTRCVLAPPVRSVSIRPHKFNRQLCRNRLRGPAPIQCAGCIRRRSECLKNDDLLPDFLRYPRSNAFDVAHHFRNGLIREALRK